MYPTAIGIVMFACTFGGALCGIKLGAILPPHHLSAQSRDTVKVGIGLIATMTALVLGLVTASAKSSFDARDTAVKHAAADIISLDRNLAQYGPETAAIRAALKRAVAHRIEMTWPEGRSRPIQLDPSYAARGVERIAAQIRDLSPQTNNQRQLKSRALALSESLLEARWLVFGDFGTSIPVPFLTVLLFWLTMTFVSFGLLAPRNATVVSVLFVCAVSVACAVFLVLEMDGAFEGLITVSPNALKYALAHLNQ